jgi:hypothetical protein
MASPQSSQDDKKVPDNEHEHDAPRSHTQPGTNVKSGLEVFEQDSTGRPPFVLNRAELKLLGIAGVGFFLDGAFETCSC